jgi:hypothetical protein
MKILGTISSLLQDLKPEPTLIWDVDLVRKDI